MPDRAAPGRYRSGPASATPRFRSSETDPPVSGDKSLRCPCRETSGSHDYGITNTVIRMPYERAVGSGLPNTESTRQRDECSKNTSPHTDENHTGTLQSLLNLNDRAPDAPK